MKNIKVGYTRVTDVLSPFTGFSKIPTWVLDKAAERGTAVHKMFEDMSTGKEVDEADANEYAAYYQSLCKWMTGKDFMFPMDRLYSEDYKITGLIDGIYQDENGEKVLFDLKTSQYIGRTWQEQLGAYLLLLDIDLGITRCEIVQLSNKGQEPNIFNFDDIELNQEVFLTCWNVYTKFFSETVEEIDTEKL